MNATTVWAEHCSDAVQSLWAAAKQAKRHRAACSKLFAAALAAQLALQQLLHSRTPSISQAQQQQRLCASITAAIELAQQRVQVTALCKVL